ncbi:NAD-dependent protein deacetylase SIR4, partial [Grifola frondosa]
RSVTGLYVDRHNRDERVSHADLSPNHTGCAASHDFVFANNLDTSRYRAHCRLLSSRKCRGNNGGGSQRRLGHPGVSGSQGKISQSKLQYHELMDSTGKGFAFRLRSYLGYPPVRDALPNTTHFALAALQYKSIVPQLITQNVDGLHHKALSGAWDEALMHERILQLHGTLHKVHCSFGHVTDRDTFQQMLSEANPQWKAFSDDLEATGSQPRTNPDGDVVLEGVSYNDFVVPNCPSCLLANRRNSVQKPEVIFFGESIPKEVKDKSFQIIDKCDRLFLLGTTLATFSAFRLLKHALELHKPVLLLNVGPTRADGLPGVEKLEIPSGLIMREVAKEVLGSDYSHDSVVQEMLRSGIIKPPPDDEDDLAPRAAG